MSTAPDSPSNPETTQPVANEAPASVNNRVAAQAVAAVAAVADNNVAIAAHAHPSRNALVVTVKVAKANRPINAKIKKKPLSKRPPANAIHRVAASKFPIAAHHSRPISKPNCKPRSADFRSKTSSLTRHCRPRADSKTRLASALRSSKSTATTCSSI